MTIEMKVIEQYFRVELFVFTVIQIFDPVDETMTIQMEVTEQFFHVKLFVLRYSVA